MQKLLRVALRGTSTSQSAGESIPTEKYSLLQHSMELLDAVDMFLALSISCGQSQGNGGNSVLIKPKTLIG